MTSSAWSHGTCVSTRSTVPCTSGSMIMFRPLMSANTRRTERKSAPWKSMSIGVPVYFFSAFPVGCAAGVCVAGFGVAAGGAGGGGAGLGVAGGGGRGGVAALGAGRGATAGGRWAWAGADSVFSADIASGGVMAAAFAIAS
jgi:hypothetical protein